MIIQFLSLRTQLKKIDGDAGVAATFDYVEIRKCNHDIKNNDKKQNTWKTKAGMLTIHNISLRINSVYFIYAFSPCLFFVFVLFVFFVIHQIVK